VKQVGSACCPFHAGFLFGLFFDSEDGGDIFLRNIVDYQRTTWRYIPEDSTLRSNRCYNLKSYGLFLVL
jgi:hypothetical protein